MEYHSAMKTKATSGLRVVEAETANQKACPRCSGCWGPVVVARDEKAPSYLRMTLTCPACQLTMPFLILERYREALMEWLGTLPLPAPQCQ